MDVYFNYVDNESVTRVRAAENEVHIAVVNHAGRFNGGTFVVGPAGDSLCQLGEKAEFRKVSLPLLEQRKKFHAAPLGWMGWSYLRPEVYRKYVP
jgi:predicted amidohydrolase